MFDKILVANRAEIAVRIMEAAQEMGIKTVAIFSSVDNDALHVQQADESYSLTGETASETYLNFDKIIEAAKTTGAQAIHPGYGFLSENADFARRCWDENIVFIGPHPDAIHQMGNKIEAKRLMVKADVPVIPGFDPNEQKITEAQLIAEAQQIGYPIMIKAATGGGGKGMRAVQSPEDLWDAYEAASREAKASFSNGTVFLEKYLEDPRHIEVQILADNFGNVIHLYERECSIQRRHQKIIEETPSPALTPELREQMGQTAIRAARAVNYNNAGTIEFILDKNNKFYFLEMNTRLQVEHAITEAVVGVDIVQWMIRISAGEVLTLKQENIIQRGHAIECRIYAENPDKLQFRPSIGTLTSFSLNILNRIGIRHDTGYTTGSRVSIHYDPMIAKLITQAETREDALKKMNWALLNYTVLGVETNTEFLRDIITHPKFQVGDVTTHFIPENFSPDWVARSKRDIPIEVVIAASLYDCLRDNGVIMANDNDESAGFPSPWQMLGTWGRQNLERSKEAFERSKEVIKESIDRTTKQLTRNINFDPRQH